MIEATTNIPDDFEEDPSDFAEFSVEMPNDCEAIAAAETAYRLANDIEGDLDMSIQSEAFVAKIKRIKRTSLFIIDKALGYLAEPYKE